MTLLIHVTGWTLVHSLWQGALVALLAAGALWLLRRASSQTRYLVACGSLVAMLASPLITARVLYRAPAAILSWPSPDVSAIGGAAEGPAATVAPASDIASFWQRRSRPAGAATLERFLPLLVTAWLAGAMTTMAGSSSLDWVHMIQEIW